MVLKRGMDPNDLTSVRLNTAYTPPKCFIGDKGFLGLGKAASTGEMKSISWAGGERERKERTLGRREGKED